MTQRPGLMVQISHFFWLSAGALSTVFCFTSAFTLPVQTGFLLAMGILFAALLTLVLYHAARPVAKLCPLLMLGGVVFYAILQWPVFGQALRICGYRMQLCITRELGTQAPVCPTDLMDIWETADVTCAAFSLLVLLLLYLHRSLNARHAFLLCFSGAAITLAPAWMFTLTPAWPPLTVLLLFWAVLALTATTRANAAFSARLGFCLTPAVALLMALLLVLVPRDTYVRPHAIDTLRLQLLPWETNRQTTPLPTTSPTSNFGSHDDTSVDFSGMGTLHHTGAPMLRVQDETRQGRFLKGYSGSVYTGSGWASYPDSEYRDLASWNLLTLHGLSRGADATSYTLTIQYLHGAPAYVHTPYYLMTARLPGTQYQHDIGIQNTDHGRTFSLTALQDTGPQDTPLGWDTYQAFVQTHYLQVPDELRSVLSQTLLSWGVTSDMDTDDQIQTVLSHLHATTQYDTNPGTTPEGQDFVSYFLLENQKGFCVHYATAATMLLRTLGIPARYVDGYVVRAENYDEQGWAVIPDRQAHAWVELFSDTLGWTPLEVTPGGSTGTIFQPPATPTPAPTITPSPLITPTPVGTPTPAPTPGTPGGVTTSSPAPAPQKQGLSVFIWILLGLLAGLGTGLLVFFLLHMCAAVKRSRSFRQRNRNKSAIAIYQYLEALAPYNPNPIPKAVRDICKKAQFSQHRLTAEELEQVRAFYRQSVKVLRATLPYKTRLSLYRRGFF